MSGAEKRSRTKTKLPHLTIEYLDHNKQRLENGKKIKSETTKQSMNTKQRDQAPTKEPRKKPEEE